MLRLYQNIGSQRAEGEMAPRISRPVALYEHGDGCGCGEVQTISCPLIFWPPFVSTSSALVAVMKHVDQASALKGCQLPLMSSKPSRAKKKGRSGFAIRK